MRCTGGSAQKGSNELEPIIRIEQLTHTYSAGTPFQRSAVDGVELDIMPGEFLGVIGHTGSGKSTLIQHLNGLLKPTQGHIYLNGKDIWADPKQIRQVRFQVGLVFQYPEYQLFEETVYKDIAFGPGNMGLDKEETDRRVRESARMVGLAEELLEKSPFDLSGGQKRRVAIAGVMAMEPKVLILDEPTAGLDPRGRDEILAQIRAYHETKRATVILVSHSMEEIARNVGRIVVMRDAHVYMDGTPRQVFARAEELEQAGLDVPQVTKIAMALRRRGMDIDPAVYTIEELEQALRAGKLTPENLQQALQSLPVMQQAQTLVRQIEQQKRQQQQAQFQKQVDEELQQIHRMEPSVKGIEDILQMDTAEAFTRYVREKGLSYLEAFKLANADRLSQRRVEQEKQRTLQAVASKRHLAPTGGTAADTVRVPQEVADLFRAMNPGMSAQDIQREYRKWYRQSP